MFTFGKEHAYFAKEMRYVLNRLTCSVEIVRRFHPDYKIEISWKVAKENFVKLDGFHQCPEYYIQQYMHDVALSGSRRLMCINLNKSGLSARFDFRDLFLPTECRLPVYQSKYNHGLII